MTIDEVKQGLKQIGPFVIHEACDDFHIFRVQETKRGPQRHSCTLFVYEDNLPRLELSAEFLEAGRQTYSVVRF